MLLAIPTILRQPAAYVDVEQLLELVRSVQSHVLARLSIDIQTVWIKRFKYRPKALIDCFSVRRDNEVVRAAPELREELDDAKTGILPILVSLVDKNRDPLRPNRRVNGLE
jgi:hypothetical protein